MVIAYSMIDKKAFSLAFKAIKADRVALLVTMAATPILHLEMAIYVGVVLSIILFIRKVAMPEIKMVKPDRPNGKFITVNEGDMTCSQLTIMQVEGSLFFGAMKN